MPVSSKYFANPAKQNRSRDRIEKILDITQDLAQENTKKPLEIRSIIGRAHISMGAIYHHFPSIGSLFASLMIRRITQSQSKAVDTIKNMGVNTGLIEFSTALVGVAFKDWSKTNLKVKNTAIRFFYRNAKEPELLFTYGDALIPHLEQYSRI
jgi:AcrR family transcriptional regulator